MNQKKKSKEKLPDYDKIVLLPWLVGESACEKSFKGSNWVGAEKLREKMTSEDIKVFGVYVDERCRKAYEEKKKWFVDIALSKTNQGRDQLYIYVANWLAGWLMKRPK